MLNAARAAIFAFTVQIAVANRRRCARLGPLAARQLVLIVGSLGSEAQRCSSLRTFSLTLGLAFDHTSLQLLTACLLVTHLHFQVADFPAARQGRCRNGKQQGCSRQTGFAWRIQI